MEAPNSELIKKDAENAELIRKAAKIIADADAILITAGAGLGVDSGLPDFRGKEGFWRAYPPMQKLGLQFHQMSNPRWFRKEPRFAWGFFGHRMDLYRNAIPHEGYHILRKFGEEKTFGYFVYTSNVDGQFERAGFSPQRIVECHGSIHYLQCNESSCIDRAVKESRAKIAKESIEPPLVNTHQQDKERLIESVLWPSKDLSLHVNMDTFRIDEPQELPSCKHCGQLARPNILMFGDGDWWEGRETLQHLRFSDWNRQLRENDTNIAIIELGAGTGVPTIRCLSEEVASETPKSRVKARLIRINKFESHMDPELEKTGEHVGLPMGALDALQQIRHVLETEFKPKEK